MRALVRQTYALQTWSVEKRNSGWWITRTYGPYARDKPRWRGPYRSMESATLMIARELRKELAQRIARAS